MGDAEEGYVAEINRVKNVAHTLWSQTAELVRYLKQEDKARQRHLNSLNEQIRVLKRCSN